MFLAWPCSLKLVGTDICRSNPDPEFPDDRSKVDIDRSNMFENPLNPLLEGRWLNPELGGRGGAGNPGSSPKSKAAEELPIKLDNRLVLELLGKPWAP